MGHLIATMERIEAEIEADKTSAQVAAAAMKSGGEIDSAPVSAEPIEVWRDGDPDVSDWVIYQPRRGTIRRGRNRVAALVVHRYPDARLLDLAIFYEASDTLDDQRVPEAVGEERGWIRKGGPPRMVVGDDILGADDSRPGSIEWKRDGLDTLRQEVADLRALILGDYDTPPASILDMMNTLDERLDALAKAPKKKRGRPPKVKAENKAATE
ncbi:MAG TPA: hypothetical protein VLJ17_15160 [Xanthobacteraceae bacterium]|nr:hypothetical protein [Xanthobacteraceae bacterium]